jgi:uncharacterized membrane protein
MSQEHVQEHIDLIAKHEQEFLARRSHAERVGDAVAGYAGSLAFLLNMLPIAGLRRFDPPPFRCSALCLRSKRSCWAASS